jgi:BirA family biotin operon repressor/biotin-[acetyl-CoA-carboxylase] ligase
VEILETTGSTSDEVRRLAAAGSPSGTVVVANHQRSGRGTLGRRWHSAPGLGVYVSVLFRPRGSAVGAPTRWTLISALAGCEACRHAARCEVEVVWPNDLYHGGRKLAGTLTELRSVSGVVQEIVVGTGFNVHHRSSDFPPDLRGRATSLAMACGARNLDRETLAAVYVECLAARLRALENGAWDELREAWYGCAPGARGSRVVVRRPGSPDVVGVTRGIDDTGALRVESGDGSILTVRSGESLVTKGA